MRIDFSTNLRNERFDTDVEVILYRVVCELLNNTLKHAEASQVSVSLMYADGLLRLDYRDDGCGFDPAAVTQKGMGIANIHSRVSTLNGFSRLTSKPGQGMKAVVEIQI